MMQSQTSYHFVCLVLALVFGVRGGCDTADTATDEVEPHFSFRLQNQSEHSGILIRFADFDSTLITDPAGHVPAISIPDGEYLVNVTYPYFETVQRKLEFVDGRLRTDSYLELKQLLQFWVEPTEALIDLDRPGYITGYIQNLTDSSFFVGTTSGHRAYAARSLGRKWRHDFCDSSTRFQTTATGSPEGVFIGPNETLEWNSRHALWKETIGYCSRPGNYEYFMAPVDAPIGAFDKGRFFTVRNTTDVTDLTNMELNNSLYRKKELFRPAQIRLLNSE